jgi:hypothetical protein
LVIVDGFYPCGWGWAESTLVKELDKLSFGGRLVCVVGGMGGKCCGRFGGDTAVVGWDNPEASGGVTFSHKHEFRFTVDFAVFLGEVDVASIVTELLDGE